MSEEYHDFDLQMDANLQTEDWQWRQEPYKCRVFRSAIEEAGGPIPAGEMLAEAFGTCEGKINAAAQSKIAALLGIIDEPVAIVAADIIP